MNAKTDWKAGSSDPSTAKLPLLGPCAKTLVFICILS